MAMPQKTDDWQTHMYRRTDLEETRARIRAGDHRVASQYAALMAAAHGLLPGGAAWSVKTGPWSVMNKTVARIGNSSRHNYVSIGICECGAMLKRWHAHAALRILLNL